MALNIPSGNHILLENTEYLWQTFCRSANQFCAHHWLAERQKVCHKYSVFSNTHGGGLASTLKTFELKGNFTI
jgi:hypothetical protein